MAIRTKELYDDIFCIPHEDQQYIIYMPLKKVVMLGNSSLVNLIYKGLSGEEDAITQLGVSNNFFTNSLPLETRIKQPLPQIPAFAPTSISLFLTNNCPLRCLYCYAEGGENKLVMPWDMVKGVLDEVLDNVLSTGKKQMSVNFHGGGDVTSAWNLLVKTRNYLNDITSPHEIQVRTSIGLSGVMNNRQRDWIVKNIHSATISLDGDPENNQLRPLANGQPSFPYVHETLKWFNEAGFNYGLRCTVTEASVSKMVQIVRFFCENYSAKKIKIEPMFPSGRANNNSPVVRSPSAKAFVENFRKAHQIAKSYGKELLYSGARVNELTNIFCQAAGETCAVTPEGWITSCYEVLSVDNPLSGVFFYGKYNAELRNMEVNENLRKNLFQLNVLNKSECQDCFCKWHCAGDCPAKSIQVKEMPSDDYPDRCYINRELTKDQLLELM